MEPGLGPGDPLVYVCSEIFWCRNNVSKALKLQNKREMKAFFLVLSDKAWSVAMKNIWMPCAFQQLLVKSCCIKKMADIFDVCLRGISDLIK